MYIAICDDDAYFRDLLAYKITEKMQKCKIQATLHTFVNGESFLAVDYSKYNAVFLDINMDGITGLEVARAITMQNTTANIIFVSSHLQFAPEGYKYQALRFVYKDRLDETLDEAIDALIKVELFKDVTLSLSLVEGRYTINQSQIVYVESKGHKLFIHLLGNSGQRILTLYDKLTSFEHRLESSLFVRIHQSYIVQLSYVDKIEKRSVILLNGISLPLSQTHSKNARSTITKAKLKL